MAGLLAQETVYMKDLMTPRAKNDIYTVDLNTFYTKETVCKVSCVSSFQQPACTSLWTVMSLDR